MIGAAQNRQRRASGSTSVAHAALVLFFLLLLGCPAPARAADSWGPWSISDDAPVITKSADRITVRKPNERPLPSMAATPCFWLLDFYQKFLGPAVSGRCPMYPTCSQYSVESIRKHGPIVGIVMTADRLIHEMDEQEYAPLVRVGNRWRYLDPVQNNDFWWAGQ